MDPTGVLISEAALAAARGGPARRHAMLAELTELFLDAADRLGEPSVEAFDAVMLPLARDAAQAPRAGLSKRLAPLRNAPRGVVRDLAYDLVPVVATPVLERSPRLDPEDLAAIAEARPQEHLLAIARRAALLPPLCEIVATRGDQTVTRTLARNLGAQLSGRARAMLTARARGDADLQDSLRVRTDLSPEERAGLAKLIESRLRHVIDRDLGTDAAQALPGPQDETHALAEAEKAVAARAREGLDERMILDWLTRRQVLEALTALARQAGVPVATALTAHRAESYETLLFLVRSAGWSWRALKLFLAAEPRRAPPRYVLEGAFQTFRDVPIETARRVVQASVGAQGSRAPRPAREGSRRPV